jgi:AcrR family transcriptional regulator
VPIVIRDKRLRPRKSPRQSRARDTRARILDPAQRVFAQHGYAGGTTNRIAEAAELSIGSLYQYFPNKDAILIKLVDAHIDAGTRALTEAIEGLLAQHAPDPPPLMDLLDTTVAVLVDLHATDRRFHRVMFEEAPRPPDVLDFVAAYEADLVERVVGVLSTHPEVRVPDVRVAARITITTIDSLIHRLATEETSHISDTQLREEVVRLTHAYLTSG